MHKVEIRREIVERVLARRGKLHLYESLDPKRTALVVIDMQNAFVAPAAPMEVPAARAIVAPINRLAAELQKLFPGTKTNVCCECTARLTNRGFHYSGRMPSRAYMASMPIRRSRRSKALAAQTVDLAFAVPQVVAHRVARMAIAGSKPSARDRQELYRMSTEKIAAVNEAWSSMAMETWLANQKLAWSFMQSLWFPWVRAKSGGSASTQLTNAAMEILAKGMTPISRRAVTNARRLSRPRRRR